MIRLRWEDLDSQVRIKIDELISLLESMGMPPLLALRFRQDIVADLFSFLKNYELIIVQDGKVSAK